MTEKNVIINNLKICYYQSDDLKKEGVSVFLHGWGSEALHLGTLLRECDNYIAIDLPGFGNSEKPETPWSVSEYSIFLKAFIEKLEIKDPVLIGHSLGASIIIKYLGSGGKAKKAVLISPSGIRERGMKIFFWYAVAKIFKVITLIPGIRAFRRVIRKSFYSAIDSEDYIEAGAMSESYKKIIREDLREDMKKIKTDTVLIWGEKDEATPLRYGVLTQQLIGNSRLDILKDAGHFSYIDQPEAFKKIFLKEIDAD